MPSNECVPSNRVGNMEKDISIIILDDEPIVCNQLANSLRKEGYATEVFTNSQDTLDCLAKKRFDILITDLKMKGLKGIDVIRFAKDKQPDIQVIVITGYATTATANEVLAAGALHFVPKPFKLQHIKDLIASMNIELSDSS